MVRWSFDTKPAPRAGGLLERDRYVTPTRIFDQMRTAYDAAENDDVVSGVVESTESLAFSKISIQVDDPDEENLWEQIQEDLDLDARLREMWREDFIVSQFYIATWWGRKTYKLKGKSDQGITRKKTYENLLVPLGITILDPMKVVPCGNLLFNQQRLAYVADQGREYDVIQAVIQGNRAPSVGVALRWASSDIIVQVRPQGLVILRRVLRFELGAMLVDRASQSFRSLVLGVQCRDELRGCQTGAALFSEPGSLRQPLLHAALEAQ